MAVILPKHRQLAIDHDLIYIAAHTQNLHMQYHQAAVNTMKSLGPPFIKPPDLKNASLEFWKSGILVSAVLIDHTCAAISKYMYSTLACAQHPQDFLYVHYMMQSVCCIQERVWQLKDSL